MFPWLFKEETDLVFRQYARGYKVYVVKPWILLYSLISICLYQYWLTSNYKPRNAYMMWNFPLSAVNTTG